jgi:hypothetical protein
MELTIKQLLSMTDEECFKMLGEVKRELADSSETFYHPSNRTSKGKPREGQKEHYHLQSVRDWLYMKINGQIAVLKQIAESRLESL